MTVLEKIQSVRASRLYILYAILFALTLPVWMLRGDLVGTVSGAVCVALFTQGWENTWQNRWAAWNRYLAYALAFGLFVFRKIYLMSDGWELAYFQTGVGMLTLCVLSQILVTIIAVRRPDYEQEMANRKIEYQEYLENVKKYLANEITDYPKSAPPPISFSGCIGRGIALGVILTAALFKASTMYPGLISTKQMAVSNFIATSIEAAKDQDHGLGELLANRTLARIDHMTATTDGFIAVLIIQMDIPLIDVAKYDINSTKALQVYLAGKKREVVEIQRSVRFEKSFLGWKVAETNFNTDNNYLYRLYQGGKPVSFTHTINVGTYEPLDGYIENMMIWKFAYGMLFVFSVILFVGNWFFSRVRELLIPSMFAVCSVLLWTQDIWGPHFNDPFADSFNTIELKELKDCRDQKEVV